MTWKTFKETVEKLGLKDDDELLYIDTNCCEVEVETKERTKFIGTPQEKKIREACVY